MERIKKFEIARRRGRGGEVAEQQRDHAAALQADVDALRAASSRAEAALAEAAAAADAARAEARSSEGGGWRNE